MSLDEMMETLRDCTAKEADSFRQQLEMGRAAATTQAADGSASYAPRGVDRRRELTPIQKPLIIRSHI